MADRKISQFEDFVGSGDSKTYFVIASGENLDAGAKNYRWDFKTLAVDMKNEMFQGTYPFSGNEESYHFGLFEPDDIRDLHFDIGNDTKFKIVSDFGVFVKDDLTVSGDAFIEGKTYVDEIFGNTADFELIKSEHGVVKNLKSISGCFSENITIGGTHLNDHTLSCNSQNYRGYITAALNSSASGLFIDAKTRDGAEDNVPLLKIDGGIASSNKTFLWANTAGNIYICDNDPEVIPNPGSSKLRVSNPAGKQLVIDQGTETDSALCANDNLVGIHTNDPQAPLHVNHRYGDSNANPITLSKMPGEQGDTFGINFNSSNSSNTNANKPYATIVTKIDSLQNNSEKGSLIFSTVNSSNLSEKVRISPDGYVGVNQSQPQSFIDIFGLNTTVNGTNGIKLSNVNTTQVHLEIGNSNDSYVGTSSNSHFNIRTHNKDAISIDASQNVFIDESPNTLGYKLNVNGPSLLKDHVIIDGATGGTHKGSLLFNTSSAAIIAATSNSIKLGSASSLSSSVNNPLTIDQNGGLTFGKTSYIDISNSTRAGMEDLIIGNNHGNSRQRINLFDGTVSNGAGMSVQASDNSGGTWTSLFAVNANSFTWNGSQMAKISDIGTGELKFQSPGGTSLGTFSANSASDATITLQDAANNGTLTFVNSSSTVLATFSANQSSNTQLTIPSIYNSTITFKKPDGTTIDSFTTNASSDKNIELDLGGAVPIATSSVVGTVKPGNGLSVDANGSLSITNWNGTLEASFYTSDSRLKNERSFLSDSLDKIKSINGYNFTWSDDAPSKLIGKKDIGVLAQDVEKVLPEAVGQDSEGNLAVAYHKMIPLLIEAIKEQDREISVLKKQVNSLLNK